MGVEAAMGQANFFHDISDAGAVVPASPGGARGGPDDSFVGGFLAAYGAAPCCRPHMMIIICQSNWGRKTLPMTGTGELTVKEARAPSCRRLVLRTRFLPDGGRKSPPSVRMEAG